MSPWAPRLLHGKGLKSLKDAQALAGSAESGAGDHTRRFFDADR
jgi:hypothetical protein